MGIKSETIIGLSNEEKERIKKCLDDIPEVIIPTSLAWLRGTAANAPLKELLIELKKAHKGAAKCISCGKRTDSVTGVCPDCMTELTAEHNASVLHSQGCDITEEEAHWAYVDEKTKKEIFKLFTPGKIPSKKEIQSILSAFGEYQKQITQSRERPSWNWCLICGNLQYSPSGLCPRCRAHIRRYGCPPSTSQIMQNEDEATIKAKKKRIQEKKIFMPEKVMPGMAQEFPLKKI